ncbi:MAG: glucoamylase family protein, partial [Flavobacteriales bacterium]
PNLINSQNIFLATIGGSIPITFSISDGNKKVTVTSPNTLRHFTRYRLFIGSALKGLQQENFAGTTQFFYTKIDPTPKFPIISDDALLTLVEQQTFKYFYDFAHPASGMARERNGSGDLVTLGGSGFGVMALIVGIERGFITRAQGMAQISKILGFLEKADRCQGVWPHWVNGNSGKTIPFSLNDNGADLVETAFMVQGLITVRQYLNGAVLAEQSLKDRINVLCEAVKWDWFTRSNQNVLYWHWSLDKGWAMNMQINGYNEALIIYTLAAASTTHTISPAVYNNGWARNGAIRNNKLFYNIKLPLGYDFGCPLFFAHYSFLGLNPKNLSDQYANYWEQNVNHTLINRAYCIANPKNFVGYSNQNWGLTASDNQSGYSAHSETNELGVISPTAALSSMPYTPTESMDALKFFYYTMGDRLWGEYGFYDAFNITEGWIANSYLAIDQGPIVVMIENHRTELLWDLFMSAPEVQAGLTKLGFSY